MKKCCRLTPSAVQHTLQGGVHRGKNFTAQVKLINECVESSALWPLELEVEATGWLLEPQKQRSHTRYP